MSDEEQRDQRKVTTTNAGNPAPSDDTSLTVGPDGPVLLQDAYLNEKLAHFVRERVPDRVYHVKGGGAFGYFEVTADVTQWTKAVFLNKVGKRTPLLIRSRRWRAKRATPTPTATRAASPSSSIPRRATMTSSATTRRSSSCVTP